MIPAEGHAPAAVDQNAVEPWCEALPLLVPAQGTIRPDEGVLQGFFSVLAVAKQVEGEASEVVVISIHQHPVRRNIAREDPRDNLGVRGGHIR